jgi:hypothetical protein
MEASATTAGTVPPAAGEQPLGDTYTMIYAVCGSPPFRRSIVVAASEPIAKTITPMSTASV